MSEVHASIEFKWNAPKKVPAEDGPALLVTSGSDVLLGVFDGMGGAGQGAYRVTTVRSQLKQPLRPKLCMIRSFLTFK